MSFWPAWHPNFMLARSGPQRNQTSFRCRACIQRSSSPASRAGISPSKLAACIALSSSVTAYIFWKHFRRSESSICWLIRFAFPVCASTMQVSTVSSANPLCNAVHVPVWCASIIIQASTSIKSPRFIYRPSGLSRPCWLYRSVSSSKDKSNSEANRRSEIKPSCKAQARSSRNFLLISGGVSFFKRPPL